MVEDSDVGQPHGYQNKEVHQDEVGHVHFMRVGNGGDVAFLEKIQRHVRPIRTSTRPTMLNELAMARAT
jgi:hypothetical protein